MPLPQTTLLLYISDCLRVIMHSSRCTNCSSISLLWGLFLICRIHSVLLSLVSTCLSYSGIWKFELSKFLLYFFFWSLSLTGFFPLYCLHQCRFGYSNYLFKFYPNLCPVIQSLSHCHCFYFVPCYIMFVCSSQVLRKQAVSWIQDIFFMWLSWVVVA